jgi:hypothetical protein
MVIKGHGDERISLRRCAGRFRSTVPAELETPAVSWPVSSWLYVYATVHQRRHRLEVSTTAPDGHQPRWHVVLGVNHLFKTGDETKRYVCAFYSDGSSVLQLVSIVSTTSPR